MVLSQPSTLLIGRGETAVEALAGVHPWGRWFGYLGYELGEWTESIRPRRERPFDLPDFWFGDFRRIDILDALPRPSAPLVHSGREPKPSLSPAEHRVCLARIREYLEAGDIYQANLTVGFEVACPEDPLDLFLRVYDAAPVPYAAYIDTGDSKILSLSPELFLRRTGGRIETVPIKGTTGRGEDPLADIGRGTWLANSAKNLSELLMIVDLERNDLGRICQTGTVEWGPFPEKLSFRNVHHLCCRVGGLLREGVGLAEILRATFPGGSISGAPKRRALEILRELEPHARGPYCGALGSICGEEMLLNLPIRTGVWHDSLLRFWGGGGIVIDCDPLEEQDEVRMKLDPFRQALGIPPDRFWVD